MLSATTENFEGCSEHNTGTSSEQRLLEMINIDIESCVQIAYRLIEIFADSTTFSTTPARLVRATTAENLLYGRNLPVVALQSKNLRIPLQQEPTETRNERIMASGL